MPTYLARLLSSLNPTLCDVRMLFPSALTYLDVDDAVRKDGESFELLKT